MRVTSLPRTFLAAGAIAIVGLTAAACSSDGEASDPATTTVA